MICLCKLCHETYHLQIKELLEFISYNMDFYIYYEFSLAILFLREIYSISPDERRNLYYDVTTKFHPKRLQGLYGDLLLTSIRDGRLD